LNAVVIECNTAFVGVLLDDYNFPTDIPEADRSLIRRSFLAADLLPLKACEEMKFSGNEDFTPNVSQIGKAMDAFAHHVLSETNNSILPADLQGLYFSISVCADLMLSV
jgi:myosin-heavy-chain kinase